MKTSWFLLRFAMAFSLIASHLNAQDSTAKVGCLVLRFDDQHSDAIWNAYRQAFKKYKCRFSFAANLGLNSLNAEPGPPNIDMLQALVADSNEFMDHTPNHSTAYITDPDAKKYLGAPGTDHFTYGLNHACFSIDWVDTTHALGDVWFNIRNESGSYIAYPLGGNLSRAVLEYPMFGAIYSPEHRLFFRVAPYFKVANGSISDSIYRFNLMNPWLEPIIGPNMDTVRFKLIHCFDVHMAEAGVEAMLQRTIDLCKQYGLPVPTTWIQPGIPNWYIDRGLLKTAAVKLGYLGGATYPRPALNCFGEYDPDSDVRFGVENNFDLDQTDLGTCEKIISDLIARHYMAIGLGHLLAPAAKIDALLAWCQRSGTRVVTYRECLHALYDVRQNPYVNIFPRLDVDLNGDGVPDGFTPADGTLDKSDGVAASGGMSYSIARQGALCRVQALGGLEKGENTFSFSTKGSGTVTVALTLHSSVDVVNKYVFAAMTSQWTRHDTTVIIPDDVSTCDIEIRASQVGSATLKVSGLSLAKVADPRALNVYTIRASAGTNGTITPGGVMSVSYGVTKTFAMSPNTGYRITDVVVDSTSVGIVPSYTFPNVSKDHTISVTFGKIRKPVAVTADAREITLTSARINGFVYPNGLPTTYRFELGSTSGYGFATPTFSLSSSDTLVPVSSIVDYLSAGTTWHYRLTASNADGSASGADFTFTTFATPVERSSDIPKFYTLQQNYPNPFNPATTIEYQLPKAGRVFLGIYNVLGQLVATLAAETEEAGHYRVRWNANVLPSGIYFCRFRAENFTETKRMILLK